LYFDELSGVYPRFFFEKLIYFNDFNQIYQIPHFLKISSYEDFLNFSILNGSKIYFNIDKVKDGVVDVKFFNYGVFKKV
jgi:hypothetical protein